MSPSEIPVIAEDEVRWRIPKSALAGMRVEGLVFADDLLMGEIRRDRSLAQVANVACLPGIVRHSLAMPDIHLGYGFCIGGVAATDPARGGVISPGGVGYDINCGVRLLRTDLSRDALGDRLEQLVDRLFTEIPTGMGRKSRFTYSKRELRELMTEGAGYVVRRGLGWESDLEVTEAQGMLLDADPDLVSERAYERGLDQCGTLGSGNHFLEVQVVEEIFDAGAATAMGLRLDQVCVMIHSGSRGLGYQVCEDALRALHSAPKKYGIDLPDRQLVAAPFDSPEGRHYFGAMCAAANYAWASRQIMTHLTRTVFAEIFGLSAEELRMHLVYDVAHNIAKLEDHQHQGKARSLCVHRKGATRAFPPGHPELPARYKEIGQPVLVPGDMGRYSYVLKGAPGSMAESFGSCCHGAGRRLSRTAALKHAKGRAIAEELYAKGIIARAQGRRGLDEEQPDAYKDVKSVVDIVEKAGLSSRVARLRPVGVIKG